MSQATLTPQQRTHMKKTMVKTIRYQAVELKRDLARYRENRASDDLLLEASNDLENAIQKMSQYISG
jgi:hypothetical protein